MQLFRRSASEPRTRTRTRWSPPAALTRTCQWRRSWRRSKRWSPKQRPTSRPTSACRPTRWVRSRGCLSRGCCQCVLEKYTPQFESECIRIGISELIRTSQLWDVMLCSSTVCSKYFLSFRPFFISILDANNWKIYNQRFVSDQSRPVNRLTGICWFVWGPAGVWQGFFSCRAF